MRAIELSSFSFADMQHAEFEVELDASEATLTAIEEQLESDSPVMQAEGAHKVTYTCGLARTESSSWGSIVCLCCSSGVFVETSSAMHQQRGLAFCQP